MYANALNSLLISHIGVHDWDMFTTNLGKPSAMHACARAISGGPVYVSDRPEEHDPRIIQRLAFADGSVPRCLRNARPTAALLFADPQREVGVPLLLQNINPCGGMVVGGFNIAGAILENDLDMFRFLQPREMQWRDAALQRKADEASEAATEMSGISNGGDGAGETHTAGSGAGAGAAAAAAAAAAADRPTSVHEMPDFADALAIHWRVSPSDVEGAAAAGRRNADYVAHRLSDGAVFVPSDSDDDGEGDGDVLVRLSTVFDHEVVSFALKHRAGPQGARWVAAVGAVAMFNPGGAVLRFSVAAYDGGLEVYARFLGAGEYLLVTNAAATAPVELTATPLHAAASYRVEASITTRPLPARDSEGEGEGGEAAFAIDIHTKIIHSDSERSQSPHKTRASSDGRDEDDRGVEIRFRLPFP